MKKQPKYLALHHVYLSKIFNLHRMKMSFLFEPKPKLHNRCTTHTLFQLLLISFSPYSSFRQQRKRGQNSTDKNLTGSVIPFDLSYSLILDVHSLPWNRSSQCSSILQTRQKHFSPQIIKTAFFWKSHKDLTASVSQHVV